MPASLTDAAEVIDTAQEGAREGTAVGTSSVAAVMTGRGGRENTGTEPEGRLDEGEGAQADLSGASVLLDAPTSEIRTVLSPRALISSAEDCIGKTGLEGKVNGSGELRPECAVAREPGPEDCNDKLDPFLDDLVEQAPPRKQLARTIVGESPGNHGL
jgi:hypothetical protein